MDMQFSCWENFRVTLNQPILRAVKWSLEQRRSVGCLDYFYSSPERYDNLEDFFEAPAGSVFLT